MISRRLAVTFAFCMALSAGPLRQVRGDNIAYDNAAGVAGLQNYAGSLGLDFTANAPLTITQLGAFTNGNPALLNGDDNVSGITAQIYTSAGVPYGPSATVSATNPGTQVNGDAFLSLSSGLFVPAGFTGSVVVSNDPNFNSNGGANTTSTLDNSGFLSFTGTGRYGAADSYPGTPDGGPANRYDAGTFAFQPNSIAFNNPTGTSQQNFGNALGMDFSVVGGKGPILVTSLGAFDNGNPANLNGVDNTSGVTVGIYDRTTQQLVPGTATVTFSAANHGTQVGGDAFLPITPFFLGPGQYSVVAYNDPNYNSGTDAGAKLGAFENHNGFITLDGARYGFTAGSYPTNPDGNFYNAGTFTYVPEPASVVLLGVGACGFLVLAGRLRRGAARRQN